MQETIINKVPHSINVLSETNELIAHFPKSNGMIRLSQTTKIVGEINGIPISQTILGEPEQLPEYTKNVYYIVSHIVKQALPDRTDLLVPSQIVRDENGVIIGCMSLDK